jgi:hypothetical protein
MPVILEVNQITVASDINGLASIVPSSGGFSNPLEVDVGVTTGVSASLDCPLQVVAPLVSGRGGVLFPPIARPVGIRVETERRVSQDH